MNHGICSDAGKQNGNDEMPRRVDAIQRQGTHDDGVTNRNMWWRQVLCECDSTDRATLFSCNLLHVSFVVLSPLGSFSLSSHLPPPTALFFLLNPLSPSEWARPTPNRALGLSSSSNNNPTIPRRKTHPQQASPPCGAPTKVIQTLILLMPIHPNKQGFNTSSKWIWN